MKKKLINLNATNWPKQIFVLQCVCVVWAISIHEAHQFQFVFVLIGGSSNC
jgi:hypothetical protein